MTVKVLFIGGYGRSGSTLLDRVMGSHDGFFSAGEIRHLFREGLVENRRCGCGLPFSECPFWSEVVATAFGRLGASDVAEIMAVKTHVDRFFRIPQIVTGKGGARFRADLDAYVDILARLYAAIARVSGARVIVDSTKDVSHGYLLARVPGVDVRQVHLVRDARAVAWSWQRKRYNPGSGGYMDRYPVIRTAAEWSVINALTRALRSRRPYRLVRYESFVVDPAATVAKVLELMDEPGPPALQGRAVDLGPSHTVAGNPMRFERGRIEVRADAGWRSAMPAPSRWVVTALSWPSLVRYGFL